MAVLTAVLWAVSLCLVWTDCCESKLVLTRLVDVQADLDTVKAKAADLALKYEKVKGRCTLVAAKKIKDKDQCSVVTTEADTTPGSTADDESLQEFCDREGEEGGWTVFQRRQDGSVNFFRNWTQYQQGFGDPSGEFWLGLEALHMLTSNQTDLRVDLMLSDGTKGCAYYSGFNVGNSNDNYRLRYSYFTGGNAGDGLSFHNNRQFSTFDRDNDANVLLNCAQIFSAGWWYDSCLSSDLNGIYPNSTNKVTEFLWGTFANEELQFAEMKLRPVSPQAETS